MGFNLTCPKCMEQSRILLDVGDMETINCNDCGEEYTIGAVRQLFASWQPFLLWVESAAKFTEQTASV